MDPSNLEDQLSGSSSSFSTPSSHFHGATGSHEWNHPENLILNTDKFNFNINTEVVSTPKDLTTTIVEDLGLQWPYNTDQSTHQVDYFPKNKEVQAVSFIKFLDFVKDPSVLYTNQFDSPNDDKTHILPSDEAQSLPAGFVLPTNNFSSSSQTTGYQSSDLLASDSNLALVREFESYGMRCLQRRPDQEPPENHIPDQTKNLVNVMKRGGNNPTDQSSSASSLQTKRPRINPKSSFSPFKVRKEKLGDRIAALQQLVAPFGKTDTSSVLMEAIGYIKFLQDQVQTLSVPYMKSSSSNRHGASQGKEVPDGQRDPESLLDLRSRGLCLVPLSCTSHVTGENVGTWPEEDSRRVF